MAPRAGGVRHVNLRRMKPDFYTKAVLTVIASALLLIACNQYVHPPAAQAQGAFAGVQFHGAADLFVFDARTGQFWGYSHEHKGAYSLEKAGKIGELGQREIPLSFDKMN